MADLYGDPQKKKPQPGQPDDVNQASEGDNLAAGAGGAAPPLGATPPQEAPPQPTTLPPGAGGAAPPTNPETGLIGAGAGGANGPTGMGDIGAPTGLEGRGRDGGAVGDDGIFRGPANPPTEPSQTKTAYQSALMKLLSDAGTPASLSDPALKAQSDAANVGLTRATEAGRAALAERMAQAGGPGVNSGAFNTELAGLFNRQGEQQANINAGLVGDANKAKIGQLQAALTMMGNDVNSEEGRALSRELAQAQLAETSREFEKNYGMEGQRLAESIRQFDTTTKAGQDALRQQLEIFKAQQAEQGRQFDVDAALKKMGIEQQGQQFTQSQAQQQRQFDVDAELKKLGINTQADLGRSDLALRDKLGTGGLNAQILSLLLNNDQFNKSEAGTNARFSAGLNNSYVQALLGQLGA